MLERQPRNYRQGARRPAGAPSALLPPYVGIPEGVIVREAASSRVSAGRVSRRPSRSEYLELIAASCRSISRAASLPDEEVCRGGIVPGGAP